ncbi:Transfer protein (Partial), partial [Seminavis robusta]|eukprot:Sro319_g116080.1 Transfer protein (162) ;mRNA; r:2-487
MMLKGLFLALLLVSFLHVGHCSSPITDTLTPDTGDTEDGPETAETESEESCGTVSSRWAEPNIMQVSKMWNFNATAQELLRNLGESLADVDHWKNDPYEVVRYLHKWDMDPSDAEKHFRGMVEWRLQNDVDTFMERYREPPAVFHYFPLFMLEGFDKEGDPI